MSATSATLDRALSRLGLCSRRIALEWIADGRVRVNGRKIVDPNHWVDLAHDQVQVDQHPKGAAAARVIALNKPRGLVTTTKDEAGRATVYQCFAGADLPWLAPVGRLDQASEGLLLFTNRPRLAHWLTAPESKLTKRYRVQTSRQLSAEECALLCTPAGGGFADLKLRQSGGKTAWYEIALTTGKNRQIRAALAALPAVEVLRLIRVAIGELPLGTLAKGEWREIGAAEQLELGWPTDVD
jgi:23S rRNA pseudouridine2605 synthase